MPLEGGASSSELELGPVKSSPVTRTSSPSIFSKVQGPRLLERELVGIEAALDRLAAGLLQGPDEFRSADGAAVVDGLSGRIEDLQLQFLDG